MKERELSSIVNQLNTLLLTANTLMCESGLMDNAEKKYGFKLYREPDKTLKSGFHYVARFKHPENGWNFKIIKSTGTDNETEAKSFAIENRDAIIGEYDKRKENRWKKNSGENLYEMLREYYRKDSKYLQDDKNKTGEDLTFQQRGIYGGFVERLLIPFLQGKKINSLQGITTEVYSELKNHLQEQTSKKGGMLSKKTCNNYLQGFVRILEYNKRHKQIQELPYEPGEALIKLAKSDKAKRKKPGLLPTAYLRYVLQDAMLLTGADGETDNLSYLLAMIGLTTGMRNSEIGRLKRKDIKPVKGGSGYYFNVFNHKTEAHNTDILEEYRKIPLHPFIVDKLKAYIENTGKEGNDYLFGKPKADKDTGQIDGYLNAEKFENAIGFLYGQIKLVETLKEGGSLPEAVAFINSDKFDKEIKKNNITFYSFRHTFQTMLAIMYPGQSLLIDYFMGHKPDRAMMANYLHINEVDDFSFWNEYGLSLIDFQASFLLPETGKISNGDIKQTSVKERDEKPQPARGDYVQTLMRAITPLLTPKEKPKSDIPANERDYL